MKKNKQLYLKGRLTKTEEMNLFKTRIFEWTEWQKATTARKVCRSLPDLSFLVYCEPDYLLGPAAALAHNCP